MTVDARTDVVGCRWGTRRRAFEDLAGALASAIRDAQDAGEVAEHADATALGYLLLSVIRGIDNMAKAGVDATTLRQTARQALELIPRADAPHVQR